MQPTAQIALVVSRKSAVIGTEQESTGSAVLPMHLPPATPPSLRIFSKVALLGDPALYENTHTKEGSLCWWPTTPRRQFLGPLAG